MAARGGDGPTPWGLGQVAEAVSRRAAVPVLLIRRGVERPGRVRDPDVPWLRRRVRALVPLDGSRTAEAAPRLLARLGAQLAITATVLHVLPGVDDPAYLGNLGSLDALLPASGPEAGSGDHPGVRPRPLCWATAAAYGHRVAGWMGAHGVPTVIQLRAGDVVEETNCAAREGADVIVLGAHAGAPGEWWSLDRVADRLLRCTTLPLLLIRTGRTGTAPTEETRPAVAEQRPSAVPALAGAGWRPA
jgi:nucleotide-binding universal stress UspA family protein